MMPTLYFDELKTPVGEICLLATEDKLCKIYLKGKPKNLTFPKKETKILSLAKKQLELYFKGKVKQFALKIELQSTSFHKVPYGTTLSYKELAVKTGLSTKHARAVGAVMRNNPIPIIYPCHRIIGSDLHLTGFGGGMEMKKYLINLEKTNLNFNLN